MTIFPSWNSVGLICFTAGDFADSAITTAGKSRMRIRERMYYNDASLLKLRKRFY
jgi:hypothetical protein